MRVLVYRQTVMPFAEYAGFLLFLNRKFDCDKLQKLQNRALQLCHDVVHPRDIRISDLHQQSYLKMFLERRELQLLGLMYDISIYESYLSLPLVCTRPAEKTTFKTDIVQYDIYRHSPYNTGCNLWNNLTAEIQNSVSRKDFKTSVQQFYKNRNLNE